MQSVVLQCVLPPDNNISSPSMVITDASKQALWQSFNILFHTFHIRWPAKSIIMNETSCANHGGVVMSVVTFMQSLQRYVLAGDDRKLPPFALTRKARRVYSTKWIEKNKNIKRKTKENCSRLSSKILNHPFGECLKYLNKERERS